jgi:hypothetical protein
MNMLSKVAPRADLWYNEALNNVMSGGACNTPDRINLYRRFIMDTLPFHAQNSKFFILYPPLDKTYQHYVYTLAYPDGKVFYVGKGTGHRIRGHEKEARKGARSYKCNVIRKIWAAGEQVLKTKLTFFKTHEEAYEYEIALIFFMDGLTNLTYGGRGGLGAVHSEESRLRHGKASRGRRHSEETKRQLSELTKKQWVSEGAEEMRNKISEANRNRVHSVEVRRRRSAAQKELWQSEEYRREKTGWTHTEEARRKMSNERRGRVGRPQTEETKRKLSNVAKGRKHTEESRRKIGEASKGRIKSEEERRKISEATKRQMSTEEARERTREINRRRIYAKPSDEVRQKISESVKKTMARKKLEGTNEA